MAESNLKHIIEGLLFVADEPLTVEKLKSIIETADNKQLREALQELSTEYENRGGGFYLSEVAGGFQLRSRPIYQEYIKRLLQPSPQRLSRAAMETLALVAYRQPIIRADIEHIRGVDCGSMLRQLMERKLIRVLGRKEIPGRPLIYATTKTFLEMFELKDLSELPSPAEIEKMGMTINNINSESEETPTTDLPCENEMDEESPEDSSIDGAIDDNENALSKEENTSVETKDEPRDSLDPNEVESETPAQEALEENLDPALQTSVDLETPAQSVPESTTVHQIPNSTEENDLSAAEDIPESEPSSNDTYDTYSDGSKKDGSKEGASNIFS